MGHRFAKPVIAAVRRADGTIVLSSRTALESYPTHLGVPLRAWAERTPERIFLAERAHDGTARNVTYREAYRIARVLASRMLEDALGPERPVMILSDNSVDHALVALGAILAGVPVAPVSVAYSLVSRDHAKLRALHALLRPGWIYAEDGNAYAHALKALDASPAHDPKTRIVLGGTSLAGLIAKAEDTPRVERAWASLTPDHTAKILFTSGSTGAPKGVINTHRMLCSNQQALAQGWPFLKDRPPVVVDWLPWSHTFGGNHNFNLVLWHGGTLWVDHGKPVAGRIEETVATLRQVSPTIYFNVPRGFDALLPHLEGDASFAESFFRDLDLLFYAAAALPRPTWERLVRLAKRVRSAPPPFVSAWGATETSPLVTQVLEVLEEAGNIGVPAPGTSLKLVPTGNKLEARVKGPQVTPGYVGDAARFHALLDDEGYYPTGDAVRLADPADPNRGIVFDGRIGEDFKLTSGTWVHVGALRLSLIKALSPFVQDAVIAGHDRDEIGVLLFPDSAACASLAPVALRIEMAKALGAHNDGVHHANSQAVRGAVLLDEPPSIDRGEITDKGYINQHAVLEHRAELVHELFGEGTERVIRVPRR